jgi:hypothetical protein
MDKHDARSQHSMPFVLNDPTQFFSTSQYTSDAIDPVLHESCHRTTFPSAFWQADNICLNFLGLFGEHVHPVPSPLFSFNIHK